MNIWKKFVLRLSAKITLVLLIIGVGSYSLLYSVTVGSLLLAIGGIVILLLSSVFVWDVLGVDLYVSTSDFPSKTTKRIDQMLEDVRSLEDLALSIKNGIDEDLIEKMALFTKIRKDLMSLKDDVNC